MKYSALDGNDNFGQQNYTQNSCFCLNSVQVQTIMFETLKILLWYEYFNPA